MPIYEFYCAGCHTLFSFYSARVNTEARPACPRCRRPGLERRLSSFATPRGGDGGDGLPDLDEGRVERAMAALAREAGRLDENDPRQAAQLMRKLGDATGLSLGDGMEEALRRIEGGEDPDRVEAEMGDLLDGPDALQPAAGRTADGAGGGVRPAGSPPARDDKLYTL